MAGKPAARIGDQTAHGGTITGPGCPTVLIGGKPACVMGDQHTCPMQTPGVPPIPHVGGPIIATGATVLIGGKPSARMGDTAICVGPPSTIIIGEFMVLIGDGGGGGGGGGAGSGEAKAAETSAAATEEAKGHYLDVKFVDKGGQPITGVKYETKDPKGEQSSGSLSGQIKSQGVEEGSHEISLKAISKVAWSKKDAAVGDKVKMNVETAGIDSGEKATLQIFVKDAKFADHLLEAIKTEVKSDKIEEEWELKVDEKLIKEQDSKEGKGYSTPYYFFTVDVAGLKQRSGFLRYRDYIELELKDEDGNAIGGAEYKIFLPNGGIKTGTLDKNGYAKVEKLPPGKVKVTYDVRKSGS